MNDEIVDDVPLFVACLLCSKDAIFNNKKAIRGGVPVVFRKCYMKQLVCVHVCMRVCVRACICHACVHACVCVRV